MPNLNTAYQWAIEKCNDPNVGYSQPYRNEQTVDGITYYDCSSFIWYALKAGGFDVEGAYNSALWPYEGNAVTTAYLDDWLFALGFVEIPITDEWVAGDVLWRDGHTEMVYQGRTTMGAHSSSYDLKRQVSINSSPSDVSSWSRCFRYKNGTANNYDWIHGGNSEYFTTEEMRNNAICIYTFFHAKGWSLQAISALCGNIQQESTFNPCLIEIGGTGHGLVQWTPPSNLYDVLDVLYGGHSDWHLGEKQCNVLYAEFEESTGLADRGIEPQWYKQSATFPNAYPMTWDEWATSNEDPGYLALVFQANYERPADLHPERADYARKWFEFLSNIDLSDPNIPNPPAPDDTTTPIRKSGYKFTILLRRKRGGIL